MHSGFIEFLVLLILHLDTDLCKYCFYRGRITDRAQRILTSILPELVQSTRQESSIAKRRLNSLAKQFKCPTKRCMCSSAPIIGADRTEPNAQIYGPRRPIRQILLSAEKMDD